VRTLAAIGLVAVMSIIGFAMPSPASVTPETGPFRPVPACQEDQSLIGAGDFRDGRWDAYVCGPAVDDLVEVTQP